MSKMVVLSGTGHDPKRRKLKIDKRGTRYIVPKDEQYLTTTEIARALGIYQETVWRWCVKWFGPLPKDGPNRSGVGGGYRIPPPYLLVARAWQLVEQPEVRELLKDALVADPKDWVIAVDNLSSTHYTASEVVERLRVLLSTDRPPNHLTILHVGGLLQE